MKKIKEEECIRSAEAIGAELVILDWEDCPIRARDKITVAI
jgi:tRNA G18 (ribose-2'-O)-methylase SpoU